MMWKSLAAIAVSVLPVCAWAASPPQSCGDAVVRLDTERYAAMVAADFERLRTILADDLTYTHSVGRVENKEEYLKALSDGRLVYVSIAPRDVRQHPLGGGACLLISKVDMSFRANGSVQSPTMQSTAVYASRGGRLKVVAVHNSRIQAQ